MKEHFDRQAADIEGYLEEHAAAFEKRLDTHISEGHESLDEPVPPPLDATEEEIQRYKEEVLRQATSTPAGKKGS